jgi:pyruvate,water dikinase
MPDRLPSPFDVGAPTGAEGWRDLYLYSTVFSEGRREYEESRFWFQDGVHWPQVLTPWEATLVEYSLAALSQYNSRHLLLPSANGVDFRILNGYVYLSPVPAPPEQTGERVEAFMDRAGYYFENWDDLYGNWMVKVRALVAELEAIDFAPLPDVEDADTVVKSGAGVGSGYRLIAGYHRLLDLALKLWQYHFEFLNLGYAAYLDFFGFCKREWPSIPDLAIAKMVAGVEVDLFRPDEELKSLAQLALHRGIDAAFDEQDVGALWEQLARDEAGREWLAAFTSAADPWFNFSSGSGFYHSDRVWAEHLEIPVGFIRSYVTRLRRGENIARPVEAIRAERDRIVEEYGELIGSERARVAFSTKLGLARRVFPYVENHNFYVEHWSHAVIWRKMRQLGAVLRDEGFWPEAEDVFYLRRTEVDDAIWDYYSSWATPAPSAGPALWPEVVADRRRIVSVLRTCTPSPALGSPPEVVTEPFTIMLWGVTSERIAAWLGEVRPGEGLITGCAASPGIAVGRARVILSTDDIGQVQDGEVLVAPLTAPSWAPLFGRLAATVTDTGGIMSHAAIVCREYGLPAVTGTGVATTAIRTGQLVRVDGSRGIVELLE